MMAASLDPAKMTDLAQIRAALERLQEAEVVRTHTQPHPFLDSHVNNTRNLRPNWLARHPPTHTVPSHHGFRTDPPSLAVPHWLHSQRAEDAALWAQLGRHSDMQVRMGALHRTA
jgi:hypothetical protein